MSRGLTTAVATAIEQPSLAPIVFVFIDWPDTPLYLWSGYGNASWNGHTWMGTGNLGKISSVAESKDGSANGVTLVISGVSNDTLYEALQPNIKKRACDIYLGVADLSTGQLTGEPTRIIHALTDALIIKQGKETSSIELSIEKEAIDNRSRGGRYSDNEQHLISAFDGGFKYTSSMGTAPVYWGIATPTNAQTSSGGNSTIPLPSTNFLS